GRGCARRIRPSRGERISRHRHPAADGADGHRAPAPYIHRAASGRGDRTACRPRAHAHPCALRARRDLRAMSAVFVTATGTDIGKTVITSGVIRWLRGTGRAVHAIKPVVTGFAPDAWRDSDPAALLAALARPIILEEIEGISPWRLKAPLSPDMAARREGRAIPFAEVVEFCRKTLRSHPGTVLIEGIGGVMVPLDEHRTVLDWVSMLRIPSILVTGTYVGTISHTLTSLEVLARRNLDIAAVVVCESESSPASLDETIESISRFADALDVIGIPRLSAGELDHPAFGRIARLISS